jgi:hypothetical protein
MRQCGLNVEEVRFTSDNKARMVTDLAITFEQRNLVLPSTGRTLDESRAVHDLEVELFNFEPTVLRSGGVRYEAGSGYHDDLVMALCLAYAGASHAPCEPMVEFLDFDSDPAGGDRNESRFRWDRSF